MQHSESIDKIMPALATVQQQAPKIGKSERNDAQKYNYANLASYMDAIAGDMAECGLSLITSAPDIQASEGRQTSSGKPQNGVYVRLVFTLVHTSGQWISIVSWGEGQDGGDKSLYKATTGARKYGYALLFALVTTDDPEKDNPGSNGKPAAAGEPTPNLDELL
jgi:hypothetical protein